MNDSVKFLQQPAVTLLQGNIKKHLPSYQNKGFDFSKHINSDYIKSTRDMRITANLQKRIKMPTKESYHDAHNSILIYKSMPMTPSQACDERIWIYLSHFELQEYVYCRWSLPKNSNPKEQEKDQKKHILSHYFVSGNRGLLRDNAIARLWWMGHIASRSKHFTPEKALEIILLQTDVRANLLERNLSMNPDIVDAVITRLNQDYKKAKAAKKRSQKEKRNPKELSKTLFGRDKFRALMKALNRIGGYRMLDSLDFDQLQQEIAEISK